MNKMCTNWKKKSQFNKGKKKRIFHLLLKYSFFSFSEIATLKVKYDEISKQLDEVQATFNQKLKFSQRIVEEIAKLDAQETPEVPLSFIF